MTLFRRAFCTLVGAFALFVLTATPDAAQPGAPVGAGVVDPNKAPVMELQALPHIAPALAKALVAKRPFAKITDLNKFLLDQKLTQAEASDLYKKAFVKINLDAGTKEEFMLIPGVGARMSAEFAEYRPWKSWAQFDKEIGKYVGQAETDRFKQYMIMPGK
jgi:DNA uptake protein ComE-like DNA-binding protein